MCLVSSVFMSASVILNLGCGTPFWLGGGGGFEACHIFLNFTVKLKYLILTVYVYCHAVYLV
jgi:hypothetical protein